MFFSNKVCIKPTETVKSKSDDDNFIQINKGNKSWKYHHIKSDPIQQESKKSSIVSPVSVTLGDCLSCSGCITTAETVLISEQSHEKVLQVLEEKQKGLNDLIVVMTMSLQALASIAAKYHLKTIQSAAEHLSYFFHDQLGVDYIFDLSLARHICLWECGQELIQHYKQKKQERKPILSSTCPGFVCYAEKSQGSILVPLLSQVKSPQQIMGLLVKHRLHLVADSKISIEDAPRIYHITMMPCYDKKLEASRIENRLLPGDFPEVDCVLTPIEVEKILEFKEIENLTTIPRRRLNQFCTDFNLDSNIYSHLGSGSGGYAENLFRMIALHQNEDLSFSKQQSLQWKMARNADFLELNLYESGEISSSIPYSKPILSFAILNGFRNLQNLVSRLKRKACTYDYIEVSACPKGCLNGGAQFRNLPYDPEFNKKSAPDSDPVLITHEQVQNLYDQLPKTEFDLTGLDTNSHSQTQTHRLYEKLQLDDDFRLKFRTEFKELEKKFNILNSNW